MLVGEQPGDHEDLSGHPFVGAAGTLLDDVLERAGIGREEVYVTNAVKHFSWTPRGRRRIHKKPTAGQVSACRPWLVAEIEALDPELLVLLGATAARSVMGPAFRVTRQRGEVLASPLGPPALATVHPASVLRTPDDAERDRERERLIADLVVAAEWLRSRREGG
jgi:DNA polymerase